MPYLSPPTLTRSEVDAVLKVTIGHPRDHLIISLALGTGLRLGEMVGLNVGDVYMPDTGKQLHVVVLERASTGRGWHNEVLHLSKVREFTDLDELMKRFGVWRCVIDGLPETHATRDFAKRHWRRVALCFFNETQRGAPRWDWENLKVEVNRTEALDASRAAVRDRRIVLPRRTPLVEEFARHMASDAKVLDEDEETGARRYRYIKTGENHFSLAFTYAWLASANLQFLRPMILCAS